MLSVSDLQSRGLDLSRVRTCVVVAEERPRTALTQSVSKLFKDLGLHPRAVSTSFGCRANLAICLQVCGTFVLVDSQPGAGLCGEVGTELLVRADVSFLDCVWAAELHPGPESSTERRGLVRVDGMVVL